MFSLGCYRLFRQVIILGVLMLTMLLPSLSFAADALGDGNMEAAPAEPETATAASELSFEDEFGDEYADQVEIISDPLEPVNRAMFWFNDRLYFYLLKPVARGYRVVPEDVRSGISNFFYNIRSPIRVVNALFQLRFKEAVGEVWHFSINTTVGVLGFFNVTKDSGVKRSDEDFGQTLGYYGLGQGAYLVLPFLGPSSLRDGVGLVADGYIDPVYGDTEHTSDVILIKTAEAINTLSLDKDTYEAIKRDSLDPYTFVKNAYGQMRENKVKH